MPLNVKADLYGSSKSQAYNTASRSRAVRRFRLHDPDGHPTTGTFKNKNADYEEAINSLQASIGTIHPSGDIPLSGIRVTRFGPYTMLGTATYIYPRAAGGGGAVEGLVATYAGGFAGIPIYRSSHLTLASPPTDRINYDRSGATTPDYTNQSITNTGLPWGNVVWDAKADAVQQILQRPVIRVVVFANLSHNPYGQPTNLGFFVNKVNSDTIIFNTFGPGQLGPELHGIFGPESVRCDAAIVREVGTGPYRFKCQYQFTIIDGKWYKQELFTDPNIVVLPYVNNEPIYEAADFEGAFPLRPSGVPG